MKKYVLLISLAFSSLFVSCNTVRPIGYFNAKQYQKPDAVQLEDALIIELHQDIKDRFIIKGLGTKEVNIAQYRRSVHDILEDNFLMKFKHSEVVEHDEVAQSNSDAYRLIIYQINPSWQVVAVDHTNLSDTYITQRFSRKKAVFDVKSSLYQGDKMVKEIDFKTQSNQEVNSLNNAKLLLQEGLLNAQLQLQNEIIAYIESQKNTENMIQTTE